MFSKDWILEDIARKLDLAQYGGKRGFGLEHMILALMDRISLFYNWKSYL